MLHKQIQPLYTSPHILPQFERTCVVCLFHVKESEIAERRDSQFSRRRVVQQMRFVQLVDEHHITTKPTPTLPPFSPLSLNRPSSMRPEGFVHYTDDLCLAHKRTSETTNRGISI